MRERLNEPAAADAILCAGGGKTLYVGSLDDVDWHVHAVPAFVAGMTGDFRLRLPTGEWLSCRAAVIPAGVRHALEVGGDPLAVFYPDPTVVGAGDLARLGQMWNVRERVLLGRQVEIGPFRELYENPGSLDFAGESLDHLVGFLRAGASRPALDPRVARVVAWLRTNPDDLTAIDKLAATQGLSASRLLHLFTREIGVPFRRFRIWNRLQAAAALALSGCSLTSAALSAGFADSAHYSRLHREAFGVAPSDTFRRIARAGDLASEKSTSERKRLGRQFRSNDAR